MKAIRRTWDVDKEMWEECEPMYDTPIDFLNHVADVFPEFEMVESPSIMGDLCRTFTWYVENFPGTYVVVNATKKCTTARLFRKHQLRAEHIWYH